LGYKGCHSLFFEIVYFIFLTSNLNCGEILLDKKILEKIKKLANIDIEDVRLGRTTGIEENIKEKIVVDLLELLGYDKVKDMDFEHHVRNKKADIAWFLYH
jgi:hypothetical protein